MAEAHLCQLAAFENYAPHGMHVKFDFDEAAGLERSATDLALQASMHHAELAKCVRLAPTSVLTPACGPSRPCTPGLRGNVVQPLRQASTASTQLRQGLRPAP